MKRIAIFIGVTLTVLAIVPLAAQKKASTSVVALDETISAAVPVVGDDAGSVTYRVEIPDDVFQLTLRLEHSPADLDIIVSTTAGEVFAYSELTAYNETLTLSRIGDPGLESGFYDVEIAYQYSRPPVVDGVQLTEIPFRLTFDAAVLSVRERLSPGDSARGTLRPAEGMAALYEIDVPTGTLALRLDISGTDGDIDLFLSRDRMPVSPWDADYFAQTLRSTESLIVDRENVPSLRPGTYYALVLDQLSDSFDTDYVLTVHGDRDAPPLLNRPVEVPVVGTETERILLATVELLTNNGGGSGVIVSDRGHILTNWHVVEDDSGGATDEVTVGFSLDPAYPAQELFLARVVESAPDRDLALLEIVSGRYGQDLPAGAVFPAIALREGTSPVIGDTLTFVGYPWIGSTSSRATVTVTRGMVAGFQMAPFGRLIKTDAVINEGSSGGAALDSELRLVGLPTEVVGFDASQIAYIYPVTAIPPAWLEIIRGE
jgi:hypothetical protein